MSFRDGWEEAYYGHSIPDAFMHKDFIKRLSKGIQENIPLTELGIKPSEENAGTGRIEKIKRQLFLLSDVDVGNRKGKHRMGDDRNWLYFKRKDGGNATRLAYLENDPVAYTWWLHTVFTTDSAVADTINDGKFGGNGVAYLAQPSHFRLK